MRTPSQFQYLLRGGFFLFFLGIVGWVGLLLENRKEASSSELFLLPSPTPALSHEAPFYREETIDPEAIYPMAHVASLAELPSGELIATWYAGSGEVKPDVKIYCATKKREDALWSSPRILMTREQAAHDLGRYIKGLGNSLIFAEVDGTLHLLFVTISMGKWSGSMLNLTTSRDEGKTWEKSRRLFLSPFFNLSELVKNPPLPLCGGGWAVPIYQEFLGKFPEILWLKPDQHSNLQATKSRIAGGCSLFQPSMTALSTTAAVIFCRDYLTSGKIWAATSSNLGKTWSRPHPTILPNHDAGICSLRLSSGALLMAFNDGTTSRDTLRLAISKDEGATWENMATIAKEPGGDFSYPYFLQTKEGTIHLLYSWQRRHIHHVMFNEAWVMVASQQEKLKAEVEEESYSKMKK